MTPAPPCFDAPARPTPIRRLRVVELLATGTNGGAQEHVLNLLSGLDRSRYEATVVALSDGAAVRKLRRAGFEVTVIDEPDDAVAIRALVVRLADDRADVVHNHMFRAEVVGTKAAMALAEAGRPRPYVVTTIHSSRVRSAADRALLRSLTPHMDHLVAVSKAIEEKLAVEGRIVPKGPPVTRVYNGVDLERYDHQEPCCTLRDEYGMEPGSQIVGVVARLEPEKGHLTLLAAWPHVLRRVPDAYLLVVGEGSMQGELEARARQLRVADRVVFTGRRDDVPAVTAALDVAVLPSHREAQGLTILEAMALSRPVVASNVGGIPEMVEDGVTGLLVPANEPEALAAAIVRLLTDHAFADLIARAGHDRVHEEFCLERMVDEISRIYDEAAVRPTEVRRAS